MLWEKLAPGQRRVAVELCKGKSDEDIARVIGLSVSGVKSQIRAIGNKLRVRKDLHMRVSLAVMLTYDLKPELCIEAHREIFYHLTGTCKYCSGSRLLEGTGLRQRPAERSVVPVSDHAAVHPDLYLRPVSRPC